MKKNLLDLSGKVDSIRLGAIDMIADVAHSLGIPFFIIGAAARDMILLEGHNIQTIRLLLTLI